MKYITLILLVLSSYAFSEVIEVAEKLGDVETQNSQDKKGLDQESGIFKEFSSIEVFSGLLLFNWEGTTTISGRFLLDKKIYVNAQYKYIAPDLGFGTQYKVKQISFGAGFILPANQISNIDIAYYAAVNYLAAFSRDQYNYSTDLVGFNVNAGLIMVNAAYSKLIFTMDSEIALYGYELMTSNYDFIVGYKLTDKLQFRVLIGADLDFNSVHTGLSLKSTF
ncbi:MAG: hypothetical protein HRU38_12435 [Saccharospirillaceae bacterium]|nr:hypothetical protein [Pseudomonadales bacterium]NRB79454.1 hypothetical protein [Saccharospirillaceae bacterium]